MPVLPLNDLVIYLPVLPLNDLIIYSSYPYTDKMCQLPKQLQLITDAYNSGTACVRSVPGPAVDHYINYISATTLANIYKKKNCHPLFENTWSAPNCIAIKIGKSSPIRRNKFTFGELFATPRGAYASFTACMWNRPGTAAGDYINYISAIKLIISYKINFFSILIERAWNVLIYVKNRTRKPPP